MSSKVIYDQDSVDQLDSTTQILGGNFAQEPVSAMHSAVHYSISAQTQCLNGYIFSMPELQYWPQSPNFNQIPTMTFAAPSSYVLYKQGGGSNYMDMHKCKQNEFMWPPRYVTHLSLCENVNGLCPSSQSLHLL